MPVLQECTCSVLSLKDSYVHQKSKAALWAVLKVHYNLAFLREPLRIDYTLHGLSRAGLCGRIYIFKKNFVRLVVSDIVISGTAQRSGDSIKCVLIIQAKG